MMHGIEWAAGLFEGEGTIVRRHTNVSKGWSLSISSTDEDVIEAFLAAVGSGKKYGPYEVPQKGKNESGKYKPYWKWVVSDAAGIRRAGEAMMPYLLARRSERMKECLDAVQHVRARGPRTRKTKEEP